jgi:hypothetical protein
VWYLLHSSVDLNECVRDITFLILKFILTLAGLVPPVPMHSRAARATRCASSVAVAPCDPENQIKVKIPLENTLLCVDIKGHGVLLPTGLTTSETTVLSGRSLAWQSDGSSQGLNDGNGLPYSANDAGGGWQICFA